MRYGTRMGGVLALLSLLASPLYAADEFQHKVPLEFVKALLSNNTPFDVRLYAGIPSHFPAIKLPDSVVLLGSADMGHSQQVLLRVEGNGIDQRSQLISSLQDQGYILLTEVPAAAQGGAGGMPVSPVLAGAPMQLCHDEHGVLSLRITGSTSTPGFAAQPSESASSVINASWAAGAPNAGAMIMSVDCERMQQQAGAGTQSSPRINRPH